MYKEFEYLYHTWGLTLSSLSLVLFLVNFAFCCPGQVLLRFRSKLKYLDLVSFKKQLKRKKVLKVKIFISISTFPFSAPCLRGWSMSGLQTGAGERMTGAQFRVFSPQSLARPATSHSLCWSLNNAELEKSSKMSGQQLLSSQCKCGLCWKYVEDVNILETFC